VEIKLTLALPRDELSVPVARQVLRKSLGVLGVDGDCVDDILVALTEACTNVLDHATDADEYELSAGIDDDICVIEVIDRGGGFDATDLGHADADHGAEEGRGIQLMRALVDKVRFEQNAEVGNVVRLEKRLDWDDASPIKALTEGRSPIEHGPWKDDEHLEDAPEPV
jgi:serine/threonine-protein kinase RsbW